MKKPLLTVLLLLSIHILKAQQVFFIYFQSEQSMPFYVKLSDKVYPSNNIGYVLLDNLHDSSYLFTIGLPSEQVAEAKFLIPVNGLDHGFTIRKLGDGINLWDQQNMSYVARQSEPEKPQLVYETRTDSFTTLLARASNDPALVRVPVYAKKDKTPKPDTVAVAALVPKPATDTVASPSKPAEAPVTVNDLTVAGKPQAMVDTAASNPQPAWQADKKPAAAEQAITTTILNTDSIFQKSIVTKHAESSTSEGFGLVFYDQDKDDADTIRLLIPNPRPALVNAGINKRDTSTAPKFLETHQEVTAVTLKDSVVSKPELPTQALPPVNQEEQRVEKVKAEEAKPADSAHTTPRPAEEIKAPAEDTTQINEPKIIVKPSGTLIPVKSNCKAQASENDFFKLRRNMAAKVADEDMLSEAAKSFRSKCYTTEQVRLLSSLFLTAAGKYQFFDAAFLHVSDQEQFRSLITEIKEDYYIKRFKALVGE